MSISYTLGLVGTNDRGDPRLETFAKYGLRSGRISKVVIFGTAPGLAKMPDVVQVRYESISHIPEIARRRGVHVVTIGSEDIIETGLPEALRSAGIACAAPDYAAFMATEGDKGEGMSTCAHAGVPHPWFGNYTDFYAAEAFCERHFAAEGHADLPVKGTWGLGGKGVVVARTLEEAKAHLSDLFHGGFSSPKGLRSVTVQFQEYVPGRENSFFAAVNGREVTRAFGAQDYKLRFASDDPRVHVHGNRNGGGQGAYYSPRQNIADGELTLFGNDVVVKTANSLADRDMPFQGFLFPGTKGVRGNRKLLEYGARPPSPELMPIAAEIGPQGLTDMLLFAADVESEPPVFQEAKKYHVCIAVCAAGYTIKKPKGGQVIRGLEEAASHPSVEITHGDTYYNPETGEWHVNPAAGRVVFVNVTEDTLADAARVANEAASCIQWGCESDPWEERPDFRRDIGVDEIKEEVRLRSFV